ncbi:MAG TPA: hypothetical protein VMW22_00520 [Candidatus Desulfaltia sp.]|nr:hypothetical protein [Candidatus Desulfaltia sp.]
MQKDEPHGEKPHAPTTLERALRALSLAMRNLKQVKAPYLEPA